MSNTLYKIARYAKNKQNNNNNHNNKKKRRNNDLRSRGIVINRNRPRDTLDI